MPANIEVEIIQSLKFKKTKIIKLHITIPLQILSLQNIVHCEIFRLFVFKNVELKQKTQTCSLYKSRKIYSVSRTYEK